MLEYVVKSLIGACVTVAIVWASKRGNILPGLLPLVPTFSMFALLSVGAKGNADGFVQACLSSMRTLPASLAFVTTAALMIRYVDYRLAVAISFAAWSVCVALSFLVKI